MMKIAFRKAFPKTIPVMAGFLSLGIAFGILLREAGYGVGWSFMMSLLIYAGSAQFLCVELMAAGAALPQVALLTFLLNFRHFFYGLTMITRYKGVKHKGYLIFGLTDETYALLSSDQCPEGVKRESYYLAVTLLNQCYWVLGSVIGSIAGSMIPFDMTGIDFAMTALFAVLVVEQWKAQSKHMPALLGFFVAVLFIAVFGTDQFLIPTLLCICVILLGMRKRLEAR